MPPDNWLCQKLERLNLTVAEGYPSHSQDSAGLKRDQFFKVPKSQRKWYKMHLLKSDEPHRPGRSVLSWRNSEAKVSSQFPRITRASAYPSTGPPSRPIAQESLRRWERAAREDSYIINHTARFGRCSTELQEKMSQNIALLCSRLNKGKTSKDVTNALNDLLDLMAFHQKVSVAMGTSLQHLADSLFLNMSNLNLLRRDAYLDFVKQGVKQDTKNVLRNAPLFGYALFPDAAIMTAELDIQKYKASSVAQKPGPGASQHTSWKGSHRYKPYNRKDRKPAAASDPSTQQQQQPWRQFGRSRPRGRRQGSKPLFLQGAVLPTIQMTITQFQNKTMSKFQTLGSTQTLISSVVSKTLSPLNVCCPVVFHAASVHLLGPLQKRGVSPAHCQSKIKHVKGVCCVNPCFSVLSVPNVPSAVSEQNVGGRLQKFRQVWQNMGANPRVVSILKDGYTLPFKQRPRLTRFPLVQSGYASPTKNLCLKEALLSLMSKLVVEKVVVRSSQAFYNLLFLVPKPNRKWRPILDPSQLNLFLNTGTFKMETPETIRLSLKSGESVMSLDFSDAYFHIPIAQRSRKYLWFFLFNQTFQLTALPFGLATSPLGFTRVVKEAKLMAQERGIRIHQYLDDCLLRAPSPEVCLQHTQTLLALCQQLWWVVNMTKSELVPKQVFNFIGYRFDLVTGRVLLTQDRWETLQVKLRFIKNRNSCMVRQFMSLIGLLTATEKQVF